MSEEQAQTSHGPILITEGEFAGWSNWPHDAFETRAGPFYFRTDENGQSVSAFRAEQKHMNGGGFMHGGCMMTFADYALFCIAWEELKDSRAVTVSHPMNFCPT